MFESFPLTIRLTFFSFAAQDTEKTIKLLKSANQPMVKKRQIMKASFGDYRAKMLEEERRLGLGLIWSPLRRNKLSSITFFSGRRAIQFIENDTTASKDTPKNASKSYFVKKSLSTMLGREQFHFNFAVNEIENLKIEKTEEAQTGTATSDSAQPATGDSSTASSLSSGDLDTNSAKQFTATDNSFKFNFSIE